MCSFTGFCMCYSSAWSGFPFVFLTPVNLRPLLISSSQHLPMTTSLWVLAGPSSFKENFLTPLLLLLLSHFSRVRLCATPETAAHQVPPSLGFSRQDSLEEGMAIHCSILSWRIPWTQEPGRLQCRASQRVRHY